MPRLIAWIFRRLYPGPIGDEARLDLEHEYAAQLERRGAWSATLRCLGLLLRPSTWSLAIALRRAARRTRDDRVRIASLSRGRGSIVSWLDVKLGLRMLVKYPGVTLVAVFGLAIGIPVGLLPIHVLDSIQATLPFDQGERIVGLRNWDAATSSPVMFGPMLHYVAAAHGELASFGEIGVAKPGDRNLLSADGVGAPVLGAAVTASTFDILRVPPLMGRVLTESDEVYGAPDVVVIGHDVWKSRFASDPDVIGSTVHVGRVPHTVVGVMPEGFLFPVSQSVWLPLRIDPGDYEAGQGPKLTYGRLADGISVELRCGDGCTRNK